jgi:hypothetical protein
MAGQLLHHIAQHFEMFLPPILHRKFRQPTSRVQHFIAASTTAHVGAMFVSVFAPLRTFANTLQERPNLIEALLRQELLGRWQRQHRFLFL